MLDKVIFAHAHLQHGVTYLPDRIQLVVSWKDHDLLPEYPAFHLDLLGLQVNELLQDIHPTVLLQNVLPEIGGPVAIGIWRIALPIVVAFVEGKPIGSRAVKLRGHEYLVLVDSEVYQRPFLKGK